MGLFKKKSSSLAFCVIGIALVACSREEKQPSFSLPQISAVTVHEQEAEITYAFAGRVVAFRETEVRARVGGILLSRNFIEGSRVKQGDLLFEIDSAPYEAEVTRQEALVAQTEATYEQTVRDAMQAEELFEQKVQSKTLRDQALSRKNADAAALQQAKAALTRARLNLEYTRVTAPISGIANRQAIPEGSLVGTDPSSSLLTTITQNDPVYVNFSWTESEAQKIRSLINDMKIRGKQVADLKVRIRSGDGRVYNRYGTVDFTSPTLDATTGTIGVRAVVDNPEHMLVPGQFVRVTLTGLRVDKAVIIPEAALLQDSSGTFVYLVNAEKNIEKRPVIVMRQLEDRSWLLENSKPAGEKKSGNNIPLSADSPADNGTGKQQQSAPDIIGVRGGDVVVTEGHFRIGSALGQLPPGKPLVVAVTTLDGKDVIEKQAPSGKTDK